MKTRLKIYFQYQGTHYHGWQVQPQGRTIQEVLQNKLSQILQTETKVTASGRTDAGVHALEQVAHFDAMDSWLEQRDNAIEKIKQGLNSLLPKDIRVLGLEKVFENFHAVENAKSKLYTYFILNSSVGTFLWEPFCWRISTPLDLELMRSASESLIGRHDFSSFCAADSTAKTRVRTLNEIKIELLDYGSNFPFSIPIPFLKLPPDSRLISLSFNGQGFLKHMVRTLVGTLVEVGHGRRSKKEVEEILQAKDRKQAGRTAPAKGLFLIKVGY